MSLTEYNQLEEEQNLRYEYHDGDVFAMAGGDPKHGAIAVNIISLLRNALAGKGCRPFNSDVKVYIESLNKSLYPDVSVICGKAERSAKDIRALTNPRLLVEVLSESTAAYDRGEKFMYYSQLSSLKEYLLVDQNQCMIQIFYRATAEDKWQMEWLMGTEAVIYLQSININLSAEDIYSETQI